MPKLLARSADAAFWMARYFERSENLARQLQVNQTFARDRSGARNWRSILALNADEPRFRERYPKIDAQNVVRFYTLDRENFTSIIESFRAARDNARILRPLISTEMWSHINVAHNQLQGLDDGAIALPRLSNFCTYVREACETHTGIAEGTMFRDQAWQFYLIGRHIERTDQVTRLLDIKYHTLLPRLEDVGSSLDLSQWHAVLRAASGYHGYRRGHPRLMTPQKVVDFLMFDERFPRSVALNLRTTALLVSELKSRFALPGGMAAMERLDEVQAVLASFSVEEVINKGLHEFLDWIQTQLSLLTRDLGTAYFGLEEKGGNH